MLQRRRANIRFSREAADATIIADAITISRLMRERERWPASNAGGRDATARHAQRTSRESQEIAFCHARAPLHAIDITRRRNGRTRTS